MEGLVLNNANQNNNNGGCLLSVQDIHKSFGLSKVLKGISLSVGKGEILSLIGGNGAGKSTLMKIIMGIYSHDAGELFVDGEKVDFTKSAQALAKGIYMVPQEPLLFPNMTVEENILMGFSEKPADLKKRLLEKIAELGWKIDLSRKAITLSIAEQQMVEFLRGLLREARILILDEPTSSLTFDEVKSLFKSLKELQQKGIGIIYITHRLTEVFDLSTHVAILRDGIVTVSGPVKDFTKQDLLQGLLPPNSNTKVTLSTESTKVDYTREPIFKLENFTGYGFNNISLEVYPGEVLGVSGVVGSGRTEMATAIFGLDEALSGRVILDNKDITGFSTSQVIKSGINFVSEDRHMFGLFKLLDVAANTTSALLDNAKMGTFFLNEKEETLISQQYIDDFRTKVTGQDQLVGSLSGGNQQKVIIGRSLSTKPKLVIFDEPTRGIDAVARGEVYNIIHSLRNEGVSVLLISSDMDEIIELSDRTVTMYQGNITNQFSKDEITEDKLMSAAFGFLSWMG